MAKTHYRDIFEYIGKVLETMYISLMGKSYFVTILIIKFIYFFASPTLFFIFAFNFFNTANILYWSIAN